MWLLYIIHSEKEAFLAAKTSITLIGRVINRKKIIQILTTGNL